MAEAIDGFMGGFFSGVFPFAPGLSSTLPLPSLLFDRMQLYKVTCSLVAAARNN